MADKKGIYHKYAISHVDGSPIDPKAQYFVLRVDSDPSAYAALVAYHDSVKLDNPELAHDLALWMLSISADDTGVKDGYEPVGLDRVSCPFCDEVHWVKIKDSSTDVTHGMSYFCFRKQGSWTSFPASTTLDEKQEEE